VNQEAHADAPADSAPAEVEAPPQDPSSGDALCPACGQAAGTKAGRCLGCEARVDREGEPRGFKERALAVLCTPERAFEFHTAAWGWVQPWLAVVALGLLLGVVTLVRVDLSAVAQRQFERTLDSMPAQQRALMETQMETMGRFQGFAMKAQALGGPPLGALIQILVFGAAVFAGSRVLGGEKTPLDLMRCLSLVAWAGLADGLSYAARAVGVLLGTAIPMSSPAGFADPLDHQVLHVALSRLDPTVALFYVLLGVGLVVSLRFPRKRALLLSGGLYGGLSLLLVGMAGIGAMAQKMSQGAGS
jgi:hypothetical protein